MATLRIKTGRTLSIIPQSKSQTSPRWGTILLPFKHGGELVSRERDFAIVERAGIEGRKTAEDFFCNRLLLLGRQRLKCGDHLFGNNAHGDKLVFDELDVTPKCCFSLLPQGKSSLLTLVSGGFVFSSSCPSMPPGLRRCRRPRAVRREGGGRGKRGCAARLARRAIAEMLLQSHAGEIELLPALPKAWPKGQVKGLRARGGFEVEIAWADGKLARATVRSVTGTKCVVRYGEKTSELTLKSGERRVVSF